MKTADSNKQQQLARWSFILGLLSLVVWPTAIAAIVLGRKAHRQLGAEPATLGFRRLATTGIVLSCVSLGIVILLSAVVAVWVLPRGYSASQAPAVVQHLQGVHNELTKYAQMHGGSFPSTLDELVDADLLPAGQVRSHLGYRFSYRVDAVQRGAGAGPSFNASYQLWAEPAGIMAYLPGTYYFFVDESGVVRVQRGTPATRSSRAY